MAFTAGMISINNTEMSTESDWFLLTYEAMMNKHAMVRFDRHSDHLTKNVFKVNGLMIIHVTRF